MMNRVALSPGELAVLLQVAHEYREELHNTVAVDRYRDVPEAEQRAKVRSAATELMAKNEVAIDPAHTDELLHSIEDEFFGLGGLERELFDSRITDVLINGTRNVYVERGGSLERLRFHFQDEQQLLHMVDRMARRMGLVLDEQHPTLDGILTDGSRVNVIIAPLARKGPNISIRRFPVLLTGQKLIENETLSREMLAFLRGCVEARLNIVISGGTGAGKTTLLDVLSRFIPEGQRIVTIENAAEMQLQQEHVVPLESRDLAGYGTQRDLLRNSLRMRPDRIIIGECRGPEAFDMLQAMNTGHEGSLTTVHANGPRDAVTRLESMVEMTGFGIPPTTIRREIAAAIQVIVHIARLQGGVRKVTRIAEIVGMEEDVVSMDDLFVFEPTGFGKDGKAHGRLRATGNFPSFHERFTDAGVALPPTLFQR